MTVKIKNILQETRGLYEAIHRFDSAAARVLTLHVSDLRCINALESGPLSAGEIGDRLALTSGSVSSLIDRLERSGWVKRIRDPEDQRRVSVELRPAAFRRADELYGGLGRAISKALSGLTADERDVALKVIERLATGFDTALLDRQNARD